MTTKLSEQDKRDLIETYPNINPELLEREGVTNATAISRACKTTVKTINPIKETDWQKTVIDLAQANGWKVAHFRGAWSKDGKRFVTPVAADGAGFPDLVLARRGRVIFIELKTEKGILSGDQLNWQYELYGKPGEMNWIKHPEYFVWRPSDYEAIKGVLK
jgi:hypothetical protein